MNSKRSEVHSHKYPSKIVVKIGSESIGGNNPESQLKLETLVADIANIKKHVHWKVFVVTSGAVLHGKLALGMKPETRVSDEEKQLLAAIGQSHLMERWNKALNKHGLHGAQIMTTHGLIETDSSIRNGFLRSLEYIAENENTVPIVNENDPVTPEEIKTMDIGADNDKNALMIARFVQADYLAIMTNTNGVRSRAAEPKSRIESIRGNQLTDDFIQRITGNSRSSSGTGGMASKLKVAREASRHDISTYIFDGMTSTLGEYIDAKEYGIYLGQDGLRGGTMISK